jgi:fatty acid desaturase
MFKHSKLDSLLVALLFLQLSILLLPFVVSLSTPLLVMLVLFNIFLMGTNFQCIAHNFIHLPFFSSRNLNTAFSMINSLGIGVPQTMYRAHHLNHHRYNNRPEEDESSTWRHGKDGKEENIFSYSLLGVLRTDMGTLYKQASRTSTMPRYEAALLLAFFGTLFFLNWKLALLYLVPSYLGGHIFALWENHCEHHRADPHDRKRDSVSCYNHLYNLIWFNNGYHQEHHYSPQVHWTKVPMVQSELPLDRVIVKGCHLTNSF